MNPAAQLIDLATRDRTGSRSAMTAMNIVRYRVKAGRQKEFENRNRMADWAMNGCRGMSLVKTGDVTYCYVGTWDSYHDIASARPRLLRILDSFRDLLEDMGGGLGVTYAISGEAVVEITPVHDVAVL